jgi:putative redox protein
MTQGSGKAVVHYAKSNLWIGISPGGHAQRLDTDHERGSAATPLELLLIALGGCTAYDVIAILEKKRERITDYRVEVSGERRDDYPRSFRILNVHHVITGRGVSSAAVAKAIELSETKYCSVAATLRPAAEIVSSFEIIEADEAPEKLGG